jgi:hypothetical protein
MCARFDPSSLAAGIGSNRRSARRAHTRKRNYAQ